MNVLALLLLWSCNKDRFLSEEELLELDLDADGWSIADGDCNDQDPAVHPDAEEVCDGINNDCDETVDEDVGRTWYLDGDQDGFGTEDLSAWACQQPAGYVPEAGDCVDADPSINPSGEEVCDGLDNDCDGDVDELVLPTWYLDADGDGYGDPESDGVSSCTQPPGTVDNDFDCDDGDARRNALAQDTCDGVDNDCDGELDEDPEHEWALDADGDGFGDDSDLLAACLRPEGRVAHGGDCDDADPSLNPGAQELCDGVDNDCDGAVDPDDSLDAPTWYADADGDGFGDAQDSAEACQAPFGYTGDDSDCDDADATVRPGADEYCDGIDNDCDGATDEPDAVDAASWYADVDGDGWGDPLNPTAACSQPGGHVSDDSDCDDSRAADHPGADEYCDGRDNDCDGATDESGAVDEASWYLDADGDGFGDSSNRTSACDQPGGYVADSTDCDDGEATTNPDAVEYCDSVDNDCDGSTDEDDAADALTWYQDGDGDGYGASSTGTEVSCDQPSGYEAADDDCDDADASISPGATEVCDDGVDDDCDGTPDDGCPEEHCGDITVDETWSSSVPHAVTCNVVVKSGAVLTIEDGATVRFESGLGLQIGRSGSAGTLIADGSSSGITLTSAESSPAAGDWDRLLFHSAATSNTFTGVTVEYGGGRGTGAVQVAGAVDIEDCVIAHSGSAGIWVDSSGTAAISGCSISDSTDEGVYVQGALDSSGGPTFTGNTITTSGSHPVSLHPQYAGQIDSSNTLTGNAVDAVELTGGTVGADTELALLDVDWQVSGSISVRDQVNLPVLTIEDGVTVAFEPGTGLGIGDLSGRYGALYADGGSLGITLTSSEASPTVGDWEGLYLGPGFYTGDSELVGLTIEYGGGNGYGGLRSHDSDAHVQDSILQDNDVAGIYVSSGELEVTGCTIQDNAGDGVFVLGALGGDSAFANNTVTGNDDHPVVVDADAVKDLDSSSTYTGNGTDRISVRRGDGYVDETGSWQALDVDYTLAETLHVGSPASPVLTLEDGVVLYVQTDQSLEVGNAGSARPGGLVVAGSTAGVTLTSNESSPAAGDWKGLVFGRYNLDAKTSVTGLTVEYGGGNGYGCVYMTLCEVDIEDSIVQDCAGDGIHADANSELVVSGSTVQDNQGYGVYATTLGETGGPTFANNTVTGNGGYPLRVGANSWHQLDDSSSYTGNGSDLVEIDSGVVRKVGTTIQLLDVDYLVVGDVYIGDGTGTVDVEDGVSFYNGAGVRWVVAYSGAGSLTAQATGGITWTSSESTPSKGDWEGLYFNGSGSAGSVLDGVTVEYAGDAQGAAIYCYFASPTVQNTTMQYSSGYGYYGYFCGNATLSNNTYANNDGPDTN